MNEYINIGKLVATFGIQGELILIHCLAKKLVFKSGEAIFVEQVKGSYIPYFVLQSKARTQEETIVLLDDIVTKEQAHRLISKQIWLLDADFRRLAGTNSPISLLGYQLYNEGDLIGKVEEVIEQPHQVLIKTTYKGKEALIPLHEETLHKVDRKKGEVHVVLPEGLLDIYS